MDKTIDEKYPNLRRWKLPDSYWGAHWPDYFVFLGQHRDSDALTRSNFICGLKELGGETETVFTVCENHWAVGWVEWIAIHESDTAALEKANEMVGALEGYPVLNEDHFSELEYTEAESYWNSLSTSERLDYLKSHAKGVPCFAARHTWDKLFYIYGHDTLWMLDESIRGC